MPPRYWPNPDSDGRFRLAIRFTGESAVPVEEVQRLVDSWNAEQVRDGADSSQDLERPPWVEVSRGGVDVAFESRPGGRKWKKWMNSFMSWVGTFAEGMYPAAVVDRASGEVRPIWFGREQPEIPTAGPLRNPDWVPGRGSESVQMLYREMMNSIVAPFLRGHGFRRKGQQFERTTDGCHEYLNFQKNIHNTKYVVSFTVNLGVVPVQPSIKGGFSNRLGSPMPALEWWIFRDRQEMEQAARSVTTAIAEVALPIMAAETASQLDCPESADRLDNPT